MNIITINGKSFQVSGNNICITNNSVIVNGQIVNKNLSEITEIRFEGELASLNIKQGCATINGPINGPVNVGGNIRCENIFQNVNAGGNIHCHDVHGNIVAGGSVKHNKKNI